MVPLFQSDTEQHILTTRPQDCGAVTTSKGPFPSFYPVQSLGGVKSTGTGLFSDEVIGSLEGVKARQSAGCPDDAEVRFLLNVGGGGVVGLAPGGSDKAKSATFSL